MASSTTSSPNSNEQQSNFPISHLSTINVGNFVSSKLCGEKKSNNYSTWKKQMLCLIESQDLLRFINGQIQPREEDYVIWRANKLVMGWILGALDDAVLKTVANFTIARDALLELEKIFSDPGQMQPAAGNERHYLPLYRATLLGDWTRAEEILKQDTNAIEARFNVTFQIALHIAVGIRKALDFVKKLVDFMPNDLLGLKDKLGYTALHVAAQTGNTEAARILVDRRPDLLHEPNNGGEFPVHIAAISSRRKTLCYLIFETKDDVLPSPYRDETGVKLLCNVIDADLFGE